MYSKDYTFFVDLRAIYAMHCSHNNAQLCIYLFAVFAFSFEDVTLVLDKKYHFFFSNYKKQKAFVCFSACCKNLITFYFTSINFFKCTNYYCSGHAQINLEKNMVFIFQKVYSNRFQGAFQFFKVLNLSEMPDEHMTWGCLNILENFSSINSSVDAADGWLNVFEIDGDITHK